MTTRLALPAHLQLQQADGADDLPRAVVISAGQTRPVTNYPAGITITPAALAENAGQFSGAMIMLGHGADPRTPRDLAGQLRAAVYHPDQKHITAQINAYDSEAGHVLAAAITAYRLALAAGDTPPDIGLSVDGLFTLTGNQITGISRIFFADLVIRPAATATQFLAQFQETPEGDTMTTATPAPDAPAAPAPDQAAPWLNHLANQVITLTLAAQAADLPALTRQRLAAATYRDPAALTAAINQARDELAAAAAQTTVHDGPGPRAFHSVRITNPLDHARNAVEFAFGVPSATPPDHALRNWPALYRALTGDLAWHGRANREHMLFAEADTTALAGLATDAMNKIVMAQFANMSAWRWYENITAVLPNDGSVQSMKWVTYGGAANLGTVAEGASYQELAVDDTKETSAFTKYGNYIGITLEMIRNNQLAKIQLVPRALALSAIRTRSAAIAAFFTQASGTGPTLADDSTVLFHANHGSNVQTTAFSAAAAQAAALECFAHAEAGSSKSLGIMPKFYLVPDDLWFTALAAFGYGEGWPTTYTPMAQDRGAYDPRPVPLIVPDWTDANDWAYIVDPALHPVICMSYAQIPEGLPVGSPHPLPELFSVAPETGLLFTNDTLPIKVRDWFAAGVATWRGVGKRNVA